MVDTVHAIEASGDMVQPLQQQIVAREHIVKSLAEVVRGIAASRASELDITLFKSVGYIVGDVTAAFLVHETTTSTTSTTSISPSTSPST